MKFNGDSDFLFKLGDSENVFYSISIDYLQFFLYYSLMEPNVKNVMKKNGKNVALVGCSRMLITTLKRVARCVCQGQ